MKTKAISLFLLTLGCCFLSALSVQAGSSDIGVPTAGSTILGAQLPASGLAAMSVLGVLQEVPKDVDVNITTESETTTWYANPVWIAIGVLALLVVVVLVAMAMRGSGGTTVVRD